MSIYLNNAATTWPKPPEVADAVVNFIRSGGANLARGTSSERDMSSLNSVLDCRLRLASLLGGYDGDPRYITFCANITEAVNTVLMGYLKPSMSVLTTSMEHNAVMRPLRALESHGVRVDIVQAGHDGRIDTGNVRQVLGKSNYDLMIMAHASNICGTVQPVCEIAALCREFGVPLVLDTAQTAGVIPLSAQELGLAALCFTGHKGLMGPQGTGGIIWQPDFAAKVKPLVRGGTGSFSHLETQPEDMPDKYESGTPNLPGIAGLNAALTWLEQTGLEKIAARERELGEYFLTELAKIPGAFQSGCQDMSGRLSVFSVNVLADPDKPDGEWLDNGILADELARAGFETRPGLHCAPVAHKTLGSFPAGSLRVSPGYFNTEAELDQFFSELARSVSSERLHFRPECGTQKVKR